MMATRPPAANVEVKLVAEGEKDRRLADPETPFRVALLGDFTGRGNRGIVETGDTLRKRRVYVIDRDNFSAVLSQLNVEIRIPILGKDSPSITCRISDLDDFHPDHLIDNLDVFNALKETRESLEDPATFAVLTTRQADTSPGPSEPSPLEKPVEVSGDLLDQIVDATEEKMSIGRSRSASDLDEFVKKIAKPHLVGKPEPAQTEFVAKVDAAISELMRKILHHPDFQAVEAAWRGVYFLASQLETSENLKLFLIDVSKAELAADLLKSNEVTSSGVFNALVKPAMDASYESPWTVLAGNFFFDPTLEDAALLQRLAKLASAAGAPFIAAAHSTLLGCDSVANTPDPDDWRAASNEIRDAWAAVRKFPEADLLGLVLPRFLLRLPYGKETNPVERFNFEEIQALPHHEEYLWGNSAFACACLLAKTFSQCGWNFDAGIAHEIDGLPLHVYKEKSELHTQPCAEVVLTQRAAETILDKGFMPLLSFVNQDIVRLARFQSLADPPKPLRGRWS